jgi:hypothetical protein
LSGSSLDIGKGCVLWELPGRQAGFRAVKFAGRAWLLADRDLPDEFVRFGDG